MKCYQPHLINLSWFETSQPAELPGFFQTTLPSTILCTTIFFHCLHRRDEMYFWCLSIPYPFCSTAFSFLRLRESFRSLPEPPVMGWQSICVCWRGMSNGGGAVLITRPHTCTPPSSAHLIAHYLNPPSPQLCFF